MVMDGSTMLGEITLFCGVMELMGVMVGNGVTLADDAMVIV